MKGGAVAKKEVRLPGGCLGDTLLGGECFLKLVVLGRERGAQEAADLRIVLNDQNFHSRVENQR